MVFFFVPGKQPLLLISISFTLKTSLPGASKKCTFLGFQVEFSPANIQQWTVATPIQKLIKCKWGSVWLRQTYGIQVCLRIVLSVVIVIVCNCNLIVLYTSRMSTTHKCKKWLVSWCRGVGDLMIYIHTLQVLVWPVVCTLTGRLKKRTLYDIPDLGKIT